MRANISSIVPPLRQNWNEHRLRQHVAALTKVNESLKREMSIHLQSEKRLRDAERALLQREEQYALALKAANGGLWDWDLKTNTIFFSREWKAMLGYGETEFSDTVESWLRRVHPHDLAGLQAEIKRHLENHTPFLQREYRIFNKNNKPQWVHCVGMAARDAAGHAYRMAGTQADITSRKSVELGLIHDVFHDSLTGLANRALLMDRLRHAMERLGRRPGEAVGVLFMDLDRFKNVNDSLGHGVGDQLLNEFAKRLEKCMRPTDTVARFGGDEFCVLLEDIHGLTEANAIADRVHKDLRHALKVDQKEFFVTVSIGIAIAKSKGFKPEDLLRDADIAMYRAKSRGRACQEFYQSGMHLQAITLQNLESGLHRAVRSIIPASASQVRPIGPTQFVLHYQPIVSLKNGQMSGCEALIRWDQQAGRVTPDEFIPVAEETGLIVPITFWVLRESCKQMKQWLRQYRQAANWSMSVNVSARVLSQPNLVEEVATILDQTGLSGSNLKIEVTEGTLMKNSQANAAVLAELRKLGIRLSMDDFGTGYSSLNYLHRFPLDVLKIDRSFIGGMNEKDSKSNAIVRTILSLARNFNLEVIAEGVETTAQLGLLRELNCDFGQGYYFAHPTLPDQMGEMIAKDQRW
ncbi:MAG TPA: EAL domain-containing protein [Planctomycetota bacterium]|jgi:diguanylate cyclase (GGDEF)-like protein/PAS domain S-box-containing protein